MKTVAQINIERLTKADRAKLSEVSAKLWEYRINLSDQYRMDLLILLDKYEGKIHTSLDRAVLELEDAIAALEEAMLNLTALSGSDKIDPIVKSSV